MKLRDAFRRQSLACADLGSPFMGRLMGLAAERLSEHGQIGQRLFTWPGVVSSDGASLPLRFAGALHALVLTGDRLAAVYPPNEVDDDTLWAAVEAALGERVDDIMAWLDSPPQTNEVRRAAALISGAAWLTARFGLPLRVSELGASAGLNLMFDRFALQTDGFRLGPPDAALTLSPDWDGAAPPPAGIVIADRRGVDLNPIDPRTSHGRLRLRAYLWPDQPQRRAMTDAAIAVAEGEVDRADAVDWLAQRFGAEPGLLDVYYHTIAWQYLPRDARKLGDELFETMGAQATEDAPLARLWMEADGGKRGAFMGLQVWPGGERIDLGRIDFHGRWVDWRAPAP